MPQSRILAAVDLGPHSRTVIERALSQAAVHDATVTVIHCAERTTDGLRSLLAGFDDPALVDARVVEGDPATTIVALADALDARAIIVGASNRSFLEQVFRGSVTVALSRRSKRPILVARTPVLSDYRYALVAVDVDRPVAPVAAAVRRVLGPVQAEVFTVLDSAIRLQMTVAEAMPDDIEVYEKEVVQTAYATLIKAAGEVAEPGWAPRAKVAEGVPSREIRHRMEVSGSDILVLQPEARGVFLRALIGSLTEEMLARPQDCDLLILPAQA